MRKIFVFLSAAVVALLSSCAKEEIAAPDCTLDSNVLTFTAAFEESTKSVLDEDGNVAWAAGDQIKFDYEIGKEDCEPVVSDLLEETEIDELGATFTAEVPEAFAMSEKDYKESLEEGQENSRHMYVAYPASLETEYATGSYCVTIPTVQYGDFASASIALAKWDPKNPMGVLQFRNLCALVKFTVPANVSEIRFTAGRAIVGKADVGFSATTPFTPYVKKMVEGESSTTLTVKVNGAGTYYAAVAPGELENICLAYFDAEGNSVGEVVAPKGFNAERSKIYNLTAEVPEGNFPGEGGYFVKPEKCGDGSGSSWENAADYAALHALLDNSINGTAEEKARTMTVYMTAGQHNVAAQLNVSPAHNVKIYGGYPSDAKGVSLSGRDIVSNVTVLDAGNAVKMWNLTAGQWEVSGLKFQNAKAPDGAAITLKKDVAFNCYDCSFENNVATTTGAGAVYFYGLGANSSVVFENCSFVGNKATTTKVESANHGLGGAVGSANNYNNAVVTFKNCLFKNNTADRNGGAMWFRTVSARILDCNFIDNKAGLVSETVNDKGETTETFNNGFGNQIFVDSENKLSVYCDACYFSFSGLQLNSLIHINNSNAESSLALNNCVVAGAWGAGGRVSVYNGGKGKLVVSNSTLFGQMGGIIKNTSTGSVSVLNCIVPHTTASGAGNSFLNNGSGTFTVKNSLYSAVKSDQTFAMEGNLAGIFVNSDKYTEKDDEDGNLPEGKVVGDFKGNFPNNQKSYTWYKGYADGQRKDNQTSMTTVEDTRGYVHYYAWDGVYPEDADFTNATLAEVTSLVQAADADFATWLGDRLGKDIRGVQRDAASMWPGSYQK